jgi:GT2 family glycosyltransferase
MLENRRLVCYDDHMRVGITIPAYISSDILADFTRQTIESIKSKNNELEIYVVFNGGSPEFYPKVENYKLDESVKKFEVIDNTAHNVVSMAWNLGIKTGLANGCDFVMAINNDLVLHHDCVDNLVTFADMHPEFLMWSASEWIEIKTLNGIKEADINWEFNDHPHFSFFMVNQNTIDKVGYFDENFKMGYFEDADYHYRVLLAGGKAGKTEAAKFYHYGSRTIKVDDELFGLNKRSYEDNRKYLFKKWNLDFHSKVYEPPEEALKDGYQTPFNKPELGLKDW